MSESTQVDSGGSATPVESSSPTGKTLSNRDRFRNACRVIPTDYPPVWLMRQAGRVLPEYKALKEKYSFLELVQTPDLAAEVTLQPVRRFGFDAAIFFSDILVVPEAMGQGYHFREQGGIEMEFAISSKEDVDRLTPEEVRPHLHYADKALTLLRSELGEETALIGFAGSPWTLANFMMEGGSSKDFKAAKVLFHTDPELFDALMHKLTKGVCEYLRMQIEKGVDTIQIFDSLGGLLGSEQFEAASGKWIRRIIENLGDEVPIIVFARGMNTNWNAVLETGANIVGVDWLADLKDLVSRIPENVGIQGNLDPAILLTTPEITERETKRILTTMNHRPGHIFNLGHGVIPASKLENIECMIQTIRNS